MYLAVVMIAASAASAGPSAESVPAWVGKVLLAVNDEAAAPTGKADTTPEAQDSKIEHAPLEKTPRGQGVFIKAKVGDPSHLFAPLVFARKSGQSRYEAFTMKDKGKRGFRAYLPPNILSEGSFEYFIEAQHEEGGATRLGSPRKPFNCNAFDPPPSELLAIDDVASLHLDVAAIERGYHRPGGSGFMIELAVPEDEWSEELD